MKQKKFLFIGAFLFVGIISYLFFFTNFITSLYGIENNESNSTEFVSTNDFQRFNTKVEKEEIPEYNTKKEAYEDEYENFKNAIVENEKKRKLKKSKKEVFRDGTGVNDLGRMFKKDFQEKKIIDTINENEKINHSDNISLKKVNKKTYKKGKTSYTKKSNSLPESKVRPKRKNPEFGNNTITNTTTNTKKNNEGLGQIHKDQIINSRSTVVIRVTKSFTVNGYTVKKNTFLKGYVTLNQYNRAEVYINSIMDSETEKIIDVKLTLYDGYDGLKGIYYKGINDEQEAGKNVAADAIEESVDRFNIPVLGRAVSTVARKKSTRVSIKLKSGHKVIIKPI